MALKHSDVQRFYCLYWKYRERKKLTLHQHYSSVPSFCFLCLVKLEPYYNEGFSLENLYFVLFHLMTQTQLVMCASVLEQISHCVRS